VVNIGDHFVECFDFLFWNASIYECNALSFVCLFVCLFFLAIGTLYWLVKNRWKRESYIAIKKKKKKALNVQP
jgi:hypothetical protein